VKAVIVQTTVPDEETGNRIAQKVLSDSSAACVWVLPPMHSHFSWKGKVEVEKEHLVVIKTLEHRARQVEAAISECHPYECPEIMAFSPDSIAAGYLKWMEEVVR